MLKKLIKYDLRFIFKYWWIAAVVCFSLSFVGGFCINVLNTSFTERELPAVVESSATSIIVLSVLAFFALSAVSTILIFIRFYQNFFSDEGYLTFTLPVKRISLLNSKIIATVITQIATMVLITLSVCLMLVIGFWEELWQIDLWKIVLEVLKAYFNNNILCRIIYIIEVPILCVLAIIFSYLFLFCCITFASIITKKARVITSIAIYYGVNMVVSFVMQIFVLFGVGALIEHFSNLSQKLLEPIICLAGFGGIMLVALLCILLYTLQYFMLDRKLNLT